MRSIYSVKSCVSSSVYIRLIIMACGSKYLCLIFALSSLILAAESKFNDNQEISRSKLHLVQLIHTNGDRTPSQFVHNDPFNIVANFWPEGIGQLTRVGRSRMYQIGKYFHRIYRDFIPNQSNEPEILEEFFKIRSSSYRRCMESAQALMAGLLGGVQGSKQSNDTSRTSSNYSEFENLQKYWQPIPIKSYNSKGNDPLLDVDFYCPNLERLFDKLETEDFRIKQVERENHEFFNEISFQIDERLNSLKSMHLLYQELFIEHQSNYYWHTSDDQLWSDDYEIKYLMDKLRNLSQLYYTLYYDNRQIQRYISGLLLDRINSNIKNYLNQSNGDQSPKFFVYSTHDGKLVSLLQSMDIYNTNLIPPGSTIIIELHEILVDNYGNPSKSTGGKFENFYLKFYYFNLLNFNETFQLSRNLKTLEPFEIYSKKFCGPPSTTNQNQLKNACNLSYYLQQMIEHGKSIDIDYECGRKHHHLARKINQFLLFMNGLLLIMFLILVIVFTFVYYFKNNK